MIVLDGVSHRFDRRLVLRDISVCLDQRRVGVIGANGSGKSTFARLLNGLVSPTEGSVLVDGLDTRKDGRAVRSRVGFVFQDPDAQIVMPTVEEDVAFGLRNLGLTDAEIAGRVQRSLDAFGLAALSDQPAHLLSGGEKQLLAVCSALVRDPAVIVFDEPTTLLDHRNARRIREVIAALEQDVVLITHDLDLVGDCERVLVLHDGCLVADGSPLEATDAYLMQIR